MKKRIAFFDFDGTITYKDTLLEFIKFYKGPFRFYLGFIMELPVLVAFKLGLLSNQTAKEKMLQYFFGKTDLLQFQEQCDAFAQTALPTLIRPKAKLEIQKLKALNATLVLVSASPENWLSAWCKVQGFQLLATRLQVVDGNITGKIDGNNCHGTEKIRRIEEAYTLSDFDEVYCYGDTNADKPMLGLASISFYKPFR